MDDRLAANRLGIGKNVQASVESADVPVRKNLHLSTGPGTQVHIGPYLLGLGLAIYITCHQHMGASVGVQADESTPSVLIL